MRFLLASVAFGFFSTLAGCQPVHLDEAAVIHPDKSLARPADKPSSFPTLAAGYVVEPLVFTHADGNQSRGVYFRRAGAKVTVLFFGGNSFRIDDEAESAQYIRVLTASGVDLVIFDHRGYGRSDGVPTTALLSSDGIELYDDVRARVKTKLIVYGHSLGSLIAPALADRKGLDGMILEGTTTNVTDLAGVILPWYVAPFLSVTVDEKLQVVDSEVALRHYSAPILFISGKDDDVMPPALARKLFDSLDDRDKMFKLIPGYGHSDLNRSSDYLRTCQDFFARVGGG